jgi:DUF438 domain-containing protein
MTRNISKDTKINDLLAEHPELGDFLMAYHPAFKGLANSFLRRTVGRVATMGAAAGIAGVDADALVEAVRARVAGGPGGVPVPEPSAPSSKAQQAAALKDILKDLHSGQSQEEVQRRFNDFAKDLDATQIAAVEQQLVKEGVSELDIKGLCDFHARLMGGALPEHEAILPPGHPGQTLRDENQALEARAVALEALLATPGAFSAQRQTLEETFAQFATLELHYQRKENQFFPFLEKHGITAPPQVMWAVHDDIRGLLKGVREALAAGDEAGFRARLPELLHQFREMVFKEEKIFIPLCLDTFSGTEWGRIREGEKDLGYSLVTPPAWTAPSEDPAPRAPAAEALDGLKKLALDTGLLSLPQINLMLRALPLDLTFVDEHDEVRYFSDTPERIFPRSPGIIGRKVQNCHPPKSVHIVEKILAAFRDGSRNEAEFWLQLGGRFLHIRYFALRDPLGKYRGCLEVSQDLTRLRALEGERRLLEWN